MTQEEREKRAQKIVDDWNATYPIGQAVVCQSCSSVCDHVAKDDSCARCGYRYDPEKGGETCPECGSDDYLTHCAVCDASDPIYLESFLEEVDPEEDEMILENIQKFLAEREIELVPQSVDNSVDNP